jgi:hypothetical protein
MTSCITRAPPIGHAFRDWYGAAAARCAAWDVVKRTCHASEAAKATLLYRRMQWL